MILSNFPVINCSYNYILLFVFGHRLMNTKYILRLGCGAFYERFWTITVLPVSLWMKRGCGIVTLSLLWLLSVILLQLQSSVWRMVVGEPLLLLGSIALIIQSGEGYALLNDFILFFISFLCLPISACRGHDVHLMLTLE